MSKVFQYERARFVERRTTGKPFRLQRVIALSLWGVLPAILLRVTPLGYWLHLSNVGLAGLFVGPGVIAIVHALVSSFSCITQVYPDRLQVDLFVAGQRFSRNQYPWQRIESIKVFRGDAPGRKKQYILRVSPSLKVMMYFESGIELTLAPSGRCIIGSDQIEDLLAAVESQRNLFGMDLQQVRGLSFH